MATPLSNWVVEVNEAGECTSAWRGERFKAEVAGYTQYRISMAAGKEAAIARAKKLYQQLMTMRAKHDAVEAALAVAPLRPGQFAIEDHVGPYPGYTNGRTWNGWACPLFPREVADQIMALWNKNQDKTMHASYDETSD